jgi:hypothetical protein
MKDIIKFKGFNDSLFINLNLLSKERNIYVMDNHVAAMWCWLQEIELNKMYNVLHIDAHYDTKANNINTWINYLPKNLTTLNINDFLSLKYYDYDNHDGYEIIRWDNYFSIFHRLYGNNIYTYNFFTHKLGTMFDEMKNKVNEYSIPSLFNLVDHLFDEDTYEAHEWIVNIDLDFFFKKIENTDISIKFISDEGIDFFLEKIKTHISNNKVKVLTIALSPECCGGWKHSLDLMNYFGERLDIDFFLKFKPI